MESNNKKYMSKIPTAEEFLSNNINRVHFPYIDEAIEDNEGSINTILSCMIEFAKLHVKAALKEASRKAYTEYIDLTTNKIFDYTDVIADDDVEANVNKDSILKAYPLANIK